ncbi:hypothetical protein B0O99DRAFT_239716 [Bisporella sp. PMI_857]|nr:hypothetical protein B0O99DRAFT_239716 [Bisporella sp. PMI_857]
MRISQNPTALLSLIFTVLSQTSIVNAIPLFGELSFNLLLPRAGNCGADLQYTCAITEACSTANGIAFCTAGSGSNAGGFAVYTTTYTETNLFVRTSTYTSSWQAAASPWALPTSAGVVPCSAEPVQYSCGAICCASNQRCAQSGSCTLYSSTTLWTYTDQPAPTITSTISSGALPFRPTSGASIATSTASVTTTMPFLAPATASGSVFPVASSSSGGGLSAGAIAGIVIAVIAGVIILLLICFCCILKGALSGILAIFGLGKKKDRRTERTETIERYSRHGSAAGASRRDTHTGWFGRPAKVSEKRKEKSSGFGGLGAVGAGLAGLALVLGLKRRHDKKVASSRPTRSDISSSYYTDSYTGTSASSASSDRRTRDSRRHR